MSKQYQVNENIERSSAPMAMVGAGPLTSTLWKLGDDRTGWRYRFNVFRQFESSGKVSQRFHPADLLHFLKLTRVLAEVFLDDGCLTHRERAALQRMANDLDEILHREGTEPQGQKKEDKSL